MIFTLGRLFWVVRGWSRVAMILEIKVGEWGVVGVRKE